MTSLSEQLRRLRAPQTAAFKAESQRASLLFDRGDAAAYSSEKLLALGQRGFADLLKVDTGFAEFGDTLFGDSSADVERTVLSKKENGKLNETITKFLYRLTPYFLLTSAHQTLEWLIHKFRIHQYNSDEVLLCSLAHHDSSVFVKLVQICWSADRTQSPWYWLDSLRKHGVPLSRQQLVNHCASNMNFLQLVCDMALRARQVLDDNGRSAQLIYSFYASIVCGVLGGSGKVTDAVVGRLLPCIGEGLKRKDPDLVISSCMIVCQLATKVVMTAPACEALLSQSLLAIVDEGTAATALPTAAVLCQTQSVAQLPPRLVKKIIRRMDKANAWQILGKLEQRYDLDKLLSVLLTALVDKMASVDSEKRPMYEEAVRKLLDNVNSGSNVAVAALRRIFSHCNSCEECENRAEMEDAFRSVAVSIGERLRQLAITKAECVNGRTDTNPRTELKAKAPDDSSEEAIDDEAETDEPVQFQEVTSDYFHKLPQRKQQSKLEELLGSLRAADRSAALGAKRALRRIHPAPTLFQRVLENALAGKEEDATPKKKRRLSREVLEIADAERPLNDSAINQVADLLEIFLDGERTHGAAVLVGPLFSVLKKCLSAQDENAASYVMQLCMASLVEIFKSAAGSGVKANDFDVDAVVQCVRSTQTPRLHQHAFKLLSVAAGLFKEDIVIRLMPIFSFMGRGLVRQDDSHTFDVIRNAIENVVPPLLTGSRNPTATLTSVFRDFVSSVPHIPEHRRIVLLKKLVVVASGCDAVRKTGYEFADIPATRDNSGCLWMLVAVMLEYHVTHWDKKGEEEQRESIAPFVDFTIRLCCEFAPSDQLFCLIVLLRYMDQLPDENNALVGTRGQYPTLFDPSAHSSKQLRHFKFETVSFASHLLSYSGFVGKLVDAADRWSMPAELVSLFELLVEVLLSLFERSPVGGDQEAVKRYWRLLLGRAKRCLEQITALLPASVSLSIISAVLSRESIHMKRHALELLNARLLQNPTPFTKDHVDQLTSLAQQLTAWLEVEPKDQERIVLCQSQLYSLKLLIRVVSPFNANAFSETLDKVTAILSTWRRCNRLYLSNAVLCLAEAVQCSGVAAVSALPRFGNDLVSMLDSDAVWADNDLVLISGLTAAQKILEALADFCGPYLPGFLKVMAKISRRGDAVGGQFKGQLNHRMTNIRRILSAVPTRILLPALESVFGDLSERPADLVLVFLVLSDHIKRGSAAEVSPHLSQLTSLFLSFLDLRARLSQVPPADLDSAEDECVAAFVALALKISENNFRPIVFKLVDWATQERGPADRMITLFRLTSKLYDTFRGLFNLFAARIIKLAADQLGRDEPLFAGEYAAEKASALYLNAVDTISKCCQHDSHGFINRDRFDTLAGPLIDQVEACGVDPTRRGLADRLPECVAHAAIAVKDDAALKSINYQILMKTRHARPEVRVTALKVLQHLYGRLGGDATAVVAETVPFLAELIEDENEDVAAQCEKVIGTLESIVGDSLRQYF